MTLRHHFALLLPGLLLLSACGRDEATTHPSPTPGDSVRAIEDLATTTRPATPLQPNETVQGTIDVDLGEGVVAMQSIATKIPDDLGERTAERLGSADGQRQLDRARSQVGEKLGKERAAAVGAADVQALANSFAGKTMYSSDVRRIDILKAYQVTLDARSNDGRRVTVSIRLNEADLSVMNSNIEYRPEAKRHTAWFESGKDDDAASVTLSRIERTASGGFAIAGQIEASDLQPGVLSKSLQGQRIERIQAEFRFDDLPLKSSGV